MTSSVQLETQLQGFLSLTSSAQLKTQLQGALSLTSSARLETQLQGALSVTSFAQLGTRLQEAVFDSLRSVGNMTPKCLSVYTSSVQLEHNSKGSVRD